MRMVTVAAVALLLTACGMGGSETAGSDPAILCAAAPTRQGVVAAILEHIAPSGSPANGNVDRAAFAKDVTFERPVVDAVNHDTQAVTCSTDIVWKARNAATLMATPKGLDPVPGKETATRIQFTVATQIDNGAKVYSVERVDDVAAYFTALYYGNQRTKEQEQEQEQGETSQTPTAAAQFPPDITALMVQEQRENEQCRGGNGDSRETMLACNRRQASLKRLQDRGYCWGGADIGADMHFVTCKPGDKDYSPGAFDEPYFSEDEIKEAGDTSDQ